MRTPDTDTKTLCDEGQVVEYGPSVDCDRCHWGRCSVDGSKCTRRTHTANQLPRTRGLSLPVRHQLQREKVEFQLSGTGKKATETVETVDHKEN